MIFLYKSILNLKKKIINLNLKFNNIAKENNIFHPH